METETLPRVNWQRRVKRRQMISFNQYLTFSTISTLLISLDIPIALSLDCVEWFNYTFKECEHLWSSNLIEKTSMPHRERILSILSDPGVWYANAATMSMLCKLSSRRKFPLFDSLFAMRLLDSQKFLRQVFDESTFSSCRKFSSSFCPQILMGLLNCCWDLQADGNFIVSCGWAELSFRLFFLIHVLMKRRFNV